MDVHLIDDLATALLAGEDAFLTRIAQPTPILPPEVAALADPASPAQVSSALRQLAITQRSAGHSLILSAAAVLRLTALGHDDPAWGEVIPRWLVAGIDPLHRGLGLLALAVAARERLAADDYCALMDQALRLLPADSGLRAAHLHQYVLYLGLRGMLRRVGDIVDLPQAGDAEPEVDASILAECLYDAVCCGRTVQAGFLARRIAPEAAWQRDLIDLHLQYIPLFDAVLHGRPIPDDCSAPSAPVFRALLSEDHAFLAAYDTASSRGELSPLLGFDGLRVALARRDLSAARRLIDDRTSGPERHWLDDFFSARVLLLEDRVREAGAAFGKFEASALRYGSTERMEIELRLAVELSRHDCCRLGLAAGAPQSRSGTALSAAVRAPAPADAAILLGTSRQAGDIRQGVERIVAESPRCWLVMGPDDGATRSVSATIAMRTGSASVRRISAFGSEDPGWPLRCFEQARAAATSANGVLAIDDLERLAPAAQAWLLDTLEGADGGIPCRLAGCATPAIERAVEAGAWRRDLYWLFAAHRVCIAELTDRGSDLGEMATALVRAYGSSAWFEVLAMQSLRAEPMPGGWAQLRALCRTLARMRPAGTIDGRAVMSASNSLRVGVALEA